MRSSHEPFTETEHILSLQTNYPKTATVRMYNGLYESTVVTTTPAGKIDFTAEILGVPGPEGPKGEKGEEGGIGLPGPCKGCSWTTGEERGSCNVKLN